MSLKEDNRVLRILFAEDVVSDADLAVISLRLEGLKFDYQVVADRDSFRKTLRSFAPDIVISDYSMPGFNGLEALEETKSFNIDLPFILFTGSNNEETAVRCIKAGANDYIIKEHMARLPLAVRESLEQFRVQKEKRESEHRLRDNEAKLHSLFSAAPGGIGLVVDRCFVEVNDTFCRLTGYSREELVGMSSRMVYPTDEEYEYVGREKYRQIAISGTGSVETRLKCKDGKILNVIMSSAVLDPDDASKGATFTVLDITTLKAAERELRKMSTVVEQNPVSIVITDPEGNIEYVNPKFCNITGYKREELTGKNPRILSSGEMPAYEYDELWKTIKAGKIWKGEFHNRRKSGQLYWESASISPIVDEKGEITHFVGIKEDITERKRSEQVQRALYKISEEVVSSNNIEQLIGVIYDEISAVFDSKNFYIAFYDKATGMLRTPHSKDEKDELSEWSAKKSLTGYIIRTNTPVIARAGEVQAMIDSGIIEMVGTPSAVWLGVPMSLGDEVTGGLVIQDYQNAEAFSERDLELLKFIAGQIGLALQRQKSIADLRSALSLAEASNRLKTSFLNNISHEVRTPLNGIVGFAQFIVQPGITDEEKQEYLQILNSSTQRLLNTITGYMDISMITSGNQTVKNVAVNVNALLDRLYMRYLQSAKSKNLDFSEQLPEGNEKREIITDRDLLEKALGHLIENAIKFTQQGSVDFGYEIIADEINFHVHDTGEGISEEAQEQIFDFFMQEDSTTSKRFDGSGLGLSIVKGIAGLLGGSVMVQSEKGVGSLFTIHLPVKPL
jgi:PAS domain S-box-containing protein